MVIVGEPNIAAFAVMASCIVCARARTSGTFAFLTPKTARGLDTVLMSSSPPVMGANGVRGAASLATRTSSASFV